MVFQNPDSQIVATTVEEDVAFGPENLGIPAQALRQRVDWALSAVGLNPLRARASHLLSAGQKQRLAIAGALAMRPRCLVLDEATAMLDPLGRQQLLATIESLHQEGMAIVTATHHMAEAARAQHIVVLSQGRIALLGSPRTIFSQEQSLHDLKLDVPPAARLARMIAESVPNFPLDILNVTDLLEAVSARLPASSGAPA
jgi:energy-coupling factor transporter ATP-binding protein EcfA2